MHCLYLLDSYVNYEQVQVNAKCFSSQDLIELRKESQPEMYDLDLFSNYVWARSQPMSADATYLTCSLLGKDLQHPPVLGEKYSQSKVRIMDGIIGKGHVVGSNNLAKKSAKIQIWN